MMNIAVACDGRGLSDLVSEHFASCKYLLVVDMDTMSVKAIENIYDKEGTELARIVNEHSCEAVITGQFNSLRPLIFWRMNMSQDIEAMA